MPIAKSALLPVGQAAEHHSEGVVRMRIGCATEWGEPYCLWLGQGVKRTVDGPAVVAAFVWVR